MFIGRHYELTELNALYKSESFQFSVIYGRRRVGKTALINEFIKNKDAIFFTGIESNEKQNLENLSKSIFTFTDKLLENNVFQSYQAALEYIFSISENKQIIFVIDEYPYAAQATKSLASTLQLLIDKNKSKSKLFLILCGSSMSFMENHVLSYRAPLYGRRTAQFKILPFDFFESSAAFTDFSIEDMAVIYGVTGGTPQYLLQMNDNYSLKENIKQKILNPVSPLYEEPGNLLKQEVREPIIYNAIISAIAAGSSKLSEISGKTGEEASACVAYINNLISLGIIKKETPYSMKSTRKTLYRIDDNLFRFWYRFIPGNIATISQGLIEDVYNERIHPFLNDYMGSVFEDICIQFLWKLRRQGNTEINFNNIGRWWGNDPKNKCEAEIDILGTDNTESALFCECKWTNEKVDTGVLNKLVDTSNLFTYKQKFYYLFAKTGYTKGCIDKAEKMGNVKLITFNQMTVTHYNTRGSEMDNNQDQSNDLQVEEALPEYKKHFTYADYMEWDDDERWELIEGVPYLMSSPTSKHQEILGELFGQIWTFLKGKPCKVYLSPFDVRLNADTTDDTVVQPDLQIICDKSIMMKAGCKGAPDMVVEILSPSTSKKDKELKFRIYQEVGIREYWIIDPETKLTSIHILENGKYITKIYQETDKAPVHILDGFEIDLAEVFAE